MKPTTKKNNYKKTNKQEVDGVVGTAKKDGYSPTFFSALSNAWNPRSALLSVFYFSGMFFFFFFNRISNRSIMQWLSVAQTPTQKQENHLQATILNYKLAKSVLFITPCIHVHRRTFELFPLPTCSFPLRSVSVFFFRVPCQAVGQRLRHRVHGVQTARHGPRHHPV